MPRKKTPTITDMVEAAYWALDTYVELRDTGKIDNNPGLYAALDETVKWLRAEELQRL